MSRAAELVAIASAGSARLLADVQDVDERDRDDREPVLDRLARALGPDFAEQIVAALSRDALDRLDAALTPAFAERLTAAQAGERGDAV
jgi:hypothetical protein